ncbi:MAG TPA: M20/M25/M40 family metallo-hydrolase [Bacillota bacterium]|nr:M20/M25/M40 family metallo-hydrolase [Bacillota bacterium]
MKKKMKLIAVMAFIFSMLHAPVVSAVGEAPTQSVSDFDRKITARFDSERSMQHIEHLSEELGPRVTGTEAEKQAAQYIKDELERYGYEVQTEEFNIPSQMQGALTTSISEDELSIRIATGSASTLDDGVTGVLYHSGTGEKGDFSEEVEGNIALIERGELTFWEKVDHAIEAGAAGVIIYDNTEGLVPPSPSLGGNIASIPVVAITQADGQLLLSKMATENVTATIKIDELEKQTSQNIIAVKPPKGNSADDDIVYVTAHYDSVPYAPGANDNASGTSVVLELARIMKAYPTDKEVRFVFFGAEEIGLVGSRYYVSQLSPSDKNRSLANFNLDMVGTEWENATAFFVNVTDGAPNLVWQSSKKAAERLENDTLVLHQGGSSDHVSFHEAGIDSANFIRREPGTAALEPWYHTPFDTIDHISQDRIQEAGELIGSAIYDVVRKQTPQNKQPSTPIMQMQ